ncbi:hypothetical protein HAZT_HAZT009036 [Hyalella azteca]|uniref:SH3 domain-containing protein n=1 Tax=Hyalella azteca TaxID=294128 RepID=A0A6A0GQK5_HYAAZ|nr:hypothetical protein HAZT_HAZT009036 [Hyalella azteca]
MSVRVLYDFEAQPGTGEMSLREGEILTVTRQNVGDGWWEGTNALGEAGLFPAAYTEEVSSAPPSMPPPSLPPEYKAASASSWDAWESNTPANTAPPQPHNTAFKGQQVYDWDDDWDDDDDSEGGGAAGGGEANHAHGGSLAHRGHAGTHAPLTDAASMAGVTLRYCLPQ